VRDASQQYFVVNDVGFTIETGETPYFQQGNESIDIITEDGNQIISEVIDGITYNVIDEQSNFLGSLLSTPRVDLSISTDGGATFGNEWAYNLNTLAYRKNRLMWWQLGIANDFVCQFKFWGFGRFVATDGVVNIRQ